VSMEVRSRVCSARVKAIPFEQVGPCSDQREEQSVGDQEECRDHKL
jgi:hypothetical protein